MHALKHAMATSSSTSRFRILRFVLQSGKETHTVINEQPIKLFFWLLWQTSRIFHPTSTPSSRWTAYHWTFVGYPNTFCTLPYQISSDGKNHVESSGNCFQGTALTPAPLHTRLSKHKRPQVAREKRNTYYRNCRRMKVGSFWYSRCRLIRCTRLCLSRL